MFNLAKLRLFKFDLPKLVKSSIRQAQASIRQAGIDQASAGHQSGIADRAIDHASIKRQASIMQAHRQSCKRQASVDDKLQEPSHHSLESGECDCEEL